jgi:hypothetical protein
MGLRFFRGTGWGGSRKLAVTLLGVHTPSKNPPPFQICKHTSLIFFKGKFSGVWLFSAYKTTVVTFVVTLGRRWCFRVVS